MRSIKVLPESVRSWMRSGIILCDLTRVVEELVFNSLDAGATKVIIVIGVGTNYIKITDNGCGITRDGLVLVGERYVFALFEATSKFEHLGGMNTVPESFGFRGEALSSISDVSLLEVVTKAHGMPNGYRKVIKNCKCLYLGIDDDRQDVGTTVVVRDLFYNQPVRRRHLQSSPKKVLHSVKECILRIALVHLGICFKVVDVESSDELLSLYPSSSPLPLLMSSFGTEASHPLHKLDASDGELKLSGYISGPYETFSVKAFQYFYINSRYISKGPIHKLLNQLAGMYSCSDLLKADIRSQCVKRSRCQASPTYILNLTCPRAHYDLSFEPAKTCVAFKDWDPVITFIKKVVSCFWTQGAHMSEEDDMWNGADILPTKDDLLDDYGLPKKRCMTRCHQDSITLSPPHLNMSREESKLMPFSRYSCKRSQKSAVQSEDYENEMDFGCLPDNSLNFTVRSLPECKAPIVNHLGVPNSHISSEDIYLETEFSGETSNEHMDYLSDAIWNPNSLHAGCSANNRSAVKEPSVIPLHFADNDDGVNNDYNPRKSFLRSCSSRKDMLSVVGSTRGDDDPLRFQADRFKKWLYMDDKLDNGDSESDYIIRGSEPWLDDHVTIWSPPRITTTCKGSFDSILTDGDCLTEDNSHWTSPATSNQCSKSSHRSSKCDWSVSKYGEKTHVEPLTNVVSKRHFKHHRDDGFDLFAFEEGETDIFDFDNMRYSSSGEDCKKNIRNSRNDSILFPQQCDFLYETEWTRSASCHMSSSYVGVEKNKIAQCRFQDKQRKRSCSAPPFYRGKKKFVALNTLHNAPTLQVCAEASHLKHKQKSSGVDHLEVKEGSTNELRSKSRHDMKKIIDKAEISDSKVEAAHCLDVYNTNSDLPLKENQDALDFGGKWRNGCPWTSSIQKPDDVMNEDSILDISSGILHLSGDSLLPKSTSKKYLDDCKVLQQVDRKFIPVVGGGILAMIDQHAADERIRLEDLREKVLSGETKTIAYLDAEQELVLPEIGYQLLNNYSEQIQKWGWICNFHAQNSVSFKKNLNFLHNQPSVATLIAVPCILGVNLTDVDLLEFLQQLADTDGSSVIPPAVLRVLNFKACRGAIMFGDALLPSECTLIVEELKQTSMCFQCAHGRPTTAPLVNLVVLHKQIAKLANWSPSSSGPWHGLSRHRPSLDRAAQRLTSGGGQC